MSPLSSAGVRPETRPRLPRAFIIAAAIAVAFVALPIAALVQRAPWSNMGELLTSSTVLDALVLSLVVSVTATAVVVVLGTPLAWLLAHLTPRARRVMRAIVLLPMVMPPVVGGVALLYALGRRGLVGQWLERWFDITLPFTTAGAVIAATFVALPFFVVTVEAAIRQVDDDFAEASQTLGAGAVRTFRTITLPLIAPAMVAGAALAWARALGEFGATITFAGNFEGRTQTLPVATYLSLESSRPGEAIALSLVLIVISLAVLIGLRDRWLIR